jgi:prevent-host-death family protein
MCYMTLAKRVFQKSTVVRPALRPRVGVRELRQNLSVYLERVIGGERYEVTDRGRVVAMLIPIPPAATLVERLVAEGRAIPATRDRASTDNAPAPTITAATRRRIWAAFDSTREDRL